MRCAPFLLLFGLLQVSVAQTAPSEPSTFVPDITFTIQKHPTGADMVEVTARADGYPPELLRSQIDRLGEYIKSKPRGIDVGVYAPDPENPALRFTKGTFAVDGIIDRKEGTLRIRPIAQAIAGAPKPWTVHGLVIQFQGEVPTQQIPKSWPSKFVPGLGRFEGEKDNRLTGVEYRITLLSQDPAKFDIPEPGEKPAQQSQKSEPKSSMDWISVIVFVVAAIAVGVLVYSLLLRVRPKVSK